MIFDPFVAMTFHRHQPATWFPSRFSSSDVLCTPAQFQHFNIALFIPVHRSVVGTAYPETANGTSMAEINRQNYQPHGRLEAFVMPLLMYFVP
jgi:hypothetical protein